MKTKKEHVIYLAGQISDDFPETFEWRNRFKEEFKPPYDLSFPDKYKDLLIVDPYETEYGKAQDKSTYNKVGRQVFPALDYDSVKRSTIGVININHYDKSIPLLGTLYECGWYYTMPDKIKIGIFDPDLCDCISDFYQRNHPFIEQTMTLWVKDEIEAADIVKDFCGV
jgi:hypothetical protein